jgi:hypothetical protein
MKARAICARVKESNIKVLLRNPAAAPQNSRAQSRAGVLLVHGPMSASRHGQRTVSIRGMTSRSQAATSTARKARITPKRSRAAREDSRPCHR